GYNRACLQCLWSTACTHDGLRFHPLQRHTPGLQAMPGFWQLPLRSPMENTPRDIPKVWTPPPALGGKFGAINRPTAGARHEQELPRGDKPLQLYSMETPNGVKVAILLEELQALGIEGAAY